MHVLDQEDARLFTDELLEEFDPRILETIPASERV